MCSFHIKLNLDTPEQRQGKIRNYVRWEKMGQNKTNVQAKIIKIIAKTQFPTKIWFVR